MKNYKYILIVLFCYRGSVSFSNVRNQKENKRFVLQQEQGDLIIKDRIFDRQLILPGVHSYPTFNINLLVEDLSSQSQGVVDTMQGPTELTKILYDAKSYFQKGNTGKAWELVNKAEEVDPIDYRVTGMKGSLFYVAGKYLKAIEYWKRSLEVYNDQPDILHYIKKVEEKFPSSQETRTDEIAISESKKTNRGHENSNGQIYLLFLFLSYRALRYAITSGVLKKLF